MAKVVSLKDWKAKKGMAAEVPASVAAHAERVKKSIERINKLCKELQAKQEGK